MAFYEPNGNIGSYRHSQTLMGLKHPKVAAYRQEAENNQKPVNVFRVDKENFHSVFTEMFQDSLINICVNKFRNLRISVYGKGIISIGSKLQGNTEVQQLLINVLEPLFFDVVCSTADSDNNVNEVLLSKFYELFHTESLISDIGEKLQTLELDSAAPIRQFVSTLNRQLIQDLIHNRANIYEKSVVQDKEHILSDTEQSVLFYICGFILKKIDENKNLNICEEIKKSLHRNEKDSEKTFVSKFSDWTDKVNRGGLKTPSDSFFLFIRSCELCVRKNIVEKHVHGSMYTAVKEYIMEDHMVNTTVKK